MKAPLFVRKHEIAFISWVLFAFAFILRAVFAMQWQDMPYGNAPLLDARAYDDWARAIADGQWLRDRAFYQSPLYPYLLAAFYKVFGQSTFLASVLNALLDSGTVVVLSLVSRNLFGRAAQIITGLLAALYASMIFYTAPVMKEPLAGFLLALFLYTALQAYAENKLKHYVWAGVSLGFAALTRGNVMLLLPILPLLSWLRYNHVAKKQITFFILAAILIMLPATLHNVVVSHDFVPVTYADGFNLYIGHSDYANGTNSYPPEVSTDPVQEELNTTLIASRDAGKNLAPSQVSAYWRTKAFDFALHNPLREIQLFGLKLFAFWNAADSFDNYDTRFIRAQFPSLLNVPLVGFGLVSALAAFGFVASWKRKRVPLTLFAACMGVYMLSVIMFYVTDRYRLPIVIFLFPLAGAAIPAVITLWRDAYKKTLIIACTAAGIFLAVAYIPPIYPTDLTAFDWGTLTAVYADKGEHDAALDAFEKGKAISETGVGVQAYIRAAEMNEKAGDKDTATGLVTRAVELFPNDGIAHYNLARQDLLRGDVGTALVSLDEARRLAPSYTLTYYAFVRVYRQLGDKARAEKALAEGLAISPHDARLLSLVEAKP